MLASDWVDLVVLERHESFDDKREDVHAFSDCVEAVSLEKQIDPRAVRASIEGGDYAFGFELADETRISSSMCGPSASGSVMDPLASTITCSFLSLCSHRGHGEQGERGTLGVREMTHLTDHAGEEQCAFDQRESRRSRLRDRIFRPSVSAKACGDQAFPLVEASGRGLAEARADDW